MNKKKYAIATLGCRTNQYESQAYKDQLLAAGYEEAKDQEQADVCIVNTCTVTESADQRSKYQIRTLHKKHPNAKIFVTGCLAQREKAALEKLEGVERVVENLEKENLLPLAFPEERFPEFSIKNFEAHTRAFVKVQDGCNSFCSYCIIPYVRGRSRSKSIPEIIDEIKSLRHNGYKEIVLTGINIGDFDGGFKKRSEKKRLSELVYEVDKIPGIERIRISSIDPDEVEEDLLEAVISCKKTCKSMHIVLQAGSNVILKRMNRKYTVEEFYDATDRLLTAHPDFTFTTDIIVGFPGETENDFQATMDVMNRVNFAKVHMFPYSERPGTRAAKFQDHVSQQVIHERKNRLLRKSEEIAYNLRNEFIGREMSVLIESKEGEDFVCGHTDNFLPVMIKNKKLRANDIVNVRLLENTEKGFVGCEI